MEGWVVELPHMVNCEEFLNVTIKTGFLHKNKPVCCWLFSFTYNNFDLVRDSV